MTSAADRAGDHHRVQARGDDLYRNRGEEDGDDAVGVGEEGEGEGGGGRRCECGKTWLRKPAAPAAATAASKYGRRRRRKKPPDGGERRDLFGDTSDAAAVTNADAVPKIRVIGETDAGEEEEEEEDSTRELSSTNSTGGAVDEGIYDGNSSSIDSSIFANKSSSIDSSIFANKSSSSSRKSSRDVTNASREKRGGRRPSYLPTGDAISLLIIEGCELCQEGENSKTGNRYECRREDCRFNYRGVRGCEQLVKKWT